MAYDNSLKVVKLQFVL